MHQRSRFFLLLALLVPAAAGASDLERFIVVYEDSLAARGAAASAGLEIRHELPLINGVAVEMSAEEALELVGAPGVAYVEPDPPRHLLGQNVPYGIDLTGASSIAPGPDEMTVCVIDTGFDLGHPDLPKGTRVAGFGNAWDTDLCGHGTHVAGTIAALDNKKGVVGTFPGVSLYIVRVFDDCESTTNASDVIVAAGQCRDAGAKVINMSLGCTGRDCRSAAEAAAFEELEDQGILNVAAAGNDGNKKQSYPASYPPVISVAALNSSKEHAPFSQRNKKVELAAPGVGVLSTVTRGSGYTVQVKVGGSNFDGIPMLGSPNRTGRGPLVDCGLGGSPCPGGGGQICLIERGDFSFASKVENCEAGGGRGAIIYNNVSGPILGTLADAETSIPSVGVRREDGLELREELGSRSTVRTKDSGHYAHFFGTSMASPHVAGLAALIWSHDSTWTPEQLRDALQTTAEDLGPNGRDKMFGYGLVNGPQALDSLLGLP